MISNLGDGINFVAMPLLALSLTDDARLLALTTFAMFVPWLLLAFPIGVVVDRFDRRRLMIAANVARVALFSVVAARRRSTAGSTSRCLLALLLVIGCCEVLFDSSAQAFLPMIVEPAHARTRQRPVCSRPRSSPAASPASRSARCCSTSSIGLPFATNAASFAVAAALIATIRTVRVEHHDRLGPRRSADWGSTPDCAGCGATGCSARWR